MHGAAGNLDGFRVLDLAGEAGFLAGKLLAELGADVIKIEPPAGDPARRRGPFVGDRADPERSLLWLALNTSKRGVTLDLTCPRGREVFGALCAGADAVIESGGPAGPRSLPALGIDAAGLRRAHPRLVLCRLSPFGQSGPYRSRRGSDLTVLALGGNLYPTGDPDRPPVRCSLPAAYYHGGVEAAVAVAFALWGREATGRGEEVDVSLQEAVTMANMTGPAQFPLTGARGSRAGAGFRGARAVFRELWPCRDGYVSFALRGGPARIPGIQALVEYVRENGAAPACLAERDWSRYNHNLIDQEEVDAIETALGAFFRTKTMAELFAAACERNLLLAPANTAKEVVESRQAAARGFLIRLEHPELGVVLTYPGAFARSTAGFVGVRGPAPRLGQHNAEVYGQIGLDAAELAAAGVI